MALHAQGPACARGRRCEGLAFAGCLPECIYFTTAAVNPLSQRRKRRLRERSGLPSAAQQVGIKYGCEFMSVTLKLEPPHLPSARPATPPTHLQTPPLRFALPRSNTAGPVTSQLWGKDPVREVTGSPSPTHRGRHLERPDGVSHSAQLWAHIWWLLFPGMVQRAWLTHPTPDTSYVVKGNRAYPSGLPIPPTWRLCPFQYRKGSCLYSP